MIVVAEGPSAAGKTTWARSVASGGVVAENGGLTPPVGDKADVAEFWATANARRWRSALEVEAAAGVAVCDTDPLKLHYDFCLFRLGRRSGEVLRAGASACRKKIADGQLGVADLIVCSVPDLETLARQRAGDTTRTRRNFDLHSQLGDGLIAWYSALDSLDPGRVEWGFPSQISVSTPRDRYDVSLFDDWMRTLGVGLEPR